MKQITTTRTVVFYNCGCPVGTPSSWKDSKGRFVSTGNLKTTKVICRGCGREYKIVNERMV